MPTLSTMQSLCAHLTTALVLVLGLSLSTFLPSSLLTDIYRKGAGSQHLLTRLFVFPHSSPSTVSQAFNVEAVAGSLATLSVAIATVAHIIASYVLLDRYQCQKTAGMFAIVPPVIVSAWTLAFGWTEGFFVAELLSRLGFAQMAMCVGIMWNGIFDILERAVVMRTIDIQEKRMVQIG